MADTLHDLLRVLHVSTGFVGLAAFWIPALTRKGGRLHVTAGWVFAACAYVVALTALGSTSWALLHPSSWAGQAVTPGQVPGNEMFMFVAILGFLGLLLLHGVETGVRVMRTRRHPDRFAGWRLRLLSRAVPTAGLGLSGFGLFHLVQGGGLLFLIPAALGALGIADYPEDRRFLANPRPTPMAWWYKHMEGMIGSGIAFHTAFLVFGGQRLFDGAIMLGSWAFVPWILPTAIGLPAQHCRTRYY